jgi:hypothetical protein
MQWRSKQGKYLFNESNLAKVFRAKMFDGIRRLGFASDGLVQLALSVRLPWPAPPREKTPILCPHCGGLMQLLAVRLNGMMPLLC